MNSTSILPTSRTYLPRRAGTPHSHYLGLSEAEFLALSCGRHTRRLQTDWLTLFYRLRETGGLRSVTANTGAALEQPWAVREMGTMANNVRLYGLNQELELRLDYWHCGFAVAAGADHRQAAALRFYDQRGALVHSLEAEQPTRLGLAMTAPFHSSDQNREQRLSSFPSRSRGEYNLFDAECLRLWWQLPLDIPAGSVPGLPEVTRRHMLQTLGPSQAVAVDASALRTLMECIDALERESLRLTVANHGAVQRCRGRGFYASSLGDDLLLRNDLCTLRLTPAAVAAAWIVRKHTHEGERLALELHDADGELLAAIDSDERHGEVRTAWAALLGAMQEETASAGNSRRNRS